MKDTAKERLELFHELFAKTTKPQNIYAIAKEINFAINEVQWLQKDCLDDDTEESRMLQFEIASFMRRCFRNALRIALNDSTHYLYADDLAKRAGFHQYKDGNIVSIFECAEIKTNK